MSLVEALRAVSGVPDLARVAAELGFSPATVPLPPTLLPIGRAAIVGRSGGFEWIGGEADSAGGTRLARDYLKAGRAAGFLLVDLRSRVLTAAVAAPSIPMLRIALEEPEPVGLARLARCRAEPGETAAATLLRVAEALLGRGVDYRFFRAFRGALASIGAALPCRMPPRDRHAFALLQLTRILFLYFVEAKGWLAGRPRFLREEVDRCLGSRRRLHRDLLRPLFFGTLNRPPEERGIPASRFGAVPFLNGGLFEPHPLERRWRVDLPNRVLGAAFDELFERFHFTLASGDGDAIAPDLLGRVFEGVMEPEERHRSGTYYTPASLVDAVLAEGAEAWLDGRPDVRVAERGRLAPLRMARILDPAAGSGAFLLGAMRLLAGPDTAPSPGRAREVRRILRRNLHGVDRNPAAVRLAELRLWLEVIAADPGEEPASVEPLPNLDAVVRQGDSLLDPLAGLPVSPSRRGASSLGPLRAALLSATGSAKRDRFAALRRAELELARAQVAGAVDRLERRIAELLEHAAASTLFGGRAGLDRSGSARLAELRKRLHDARARARELARSDAVPWFHYSTHFADAMAAGGFDFIVGNPPWVRAEALEPDARRLLSERYRWFAPRAGAVPAYRHTADLSVAFLEQAVELLAPRGVLAFLVPSKLATTGYATAARAGLAARTTVVLAADLSDGKRAFDATVYPMALVARKSRASPAHRVRLRLGHSEPFVPQAELVPDCWTLAGGDVRAALDRLRADFPALGTRLSCHLGVKTGLNRAFLDPPAELEPAVVRWAVRGRDVEAFRVSPAVRMFWPCDDTGGPLPDLPPAAAAHVRRHLGDLRRRADLDGGPPWTLFRTGPASRPHRVIWSDLARRLAAAPLTGSRSRLWIPLNTCYVIPVRDEPAALRLSAWLNLTWCRGVAAALADPASSGFRRMNARVVSALPFPDPVLDDVALLELARRGLAGTLEQAALDERGAELLRLRKEERDALAELARERAVAGG